VCASTLSGFTYVVVAMVVPIPRRWPARRDGAAAPRRVQDTRQVKLTVPGAAPCRFRAIGRPAVDQRGPETARSSTVLRAYTNGSMIVEFTHCAHVVALRTIMGHP
jgi:hypothetical protein